MTTRYKGMFFVVVMLIISLSMGSWAFANEVSLTFNDAEFIHIFQTIGRLQGLNVLVDPSVTGRGTFELNNVSFQEALDLVTSYSGFDYLIQGTTLLIAPHAKFQGLETPAKQRVKVYRLDYAEPEIVLSALSMIVDETQIRLDGEGKSVIVRATEEQLAEVDLFLSDLDRPTPQVLLEVWVQEMSSDALQKLGVEWKGVPSFSGDTKVPAFIELAWEPWDLVLALRALEDQGKAKLLANPKISTLSGKEATIFVGDRVPIVLTSEEGARTLEFLESGINLRVTPRISEDEFITIMVRPEVSTFIWKNETDYPQIRTREAETTVRVKNGQPIVIGGLLQEQESQLLTKVPFVSQLPVLGKLFQWKETQTVQTEMTIFLIPRIVDGTDGVANQTFFIPAQ